MNKVYISDSSIYVSDGNYSSKYPRANELLQNGIPFISPANFNGNSIDDSNMKYISPEKHAELKKGHIKTDDVLITVRGNNGISVMVPKQYNDANINAQLAFIRTDNSKLLAKFIYYYFKSDNAKAKIKESETGTALKQFPINKLLKFGIPAYSKEKQIRIISVLDTLNQSILIKQNELKSLNELIKSQFIEMFGDPKTNSLDLDTDTPVNLCESISAGGDRPKEVSDIKTDEYCYPIYSNGEKDDGLYGWSKEYRIEKPSVTVSGRGTIGYTSYRKEGKFTPIVRLIVLTPNERINPVYLTYFMNMEREEGLGSGVQQLTVPMIKQKKIIVPEIELQNKFASFVEQIDKSKFIVQKQIDDLQELLDSKMQEYFGEEE